MLMMQQHSQSNDTSYRTSPSYCLRLLIRDNCNNPLLECQCCSLTNTYPRHAHIHAYTNTLQSTGTCFFFFSSNRPVFKCCMFLGYMRVKQPIVHRRQLPPWHEASHQRGGRTSTSAQPISPHPPAARWAGTCTAAVGSEPASSALPPARAPSSASPPEPQWSEQNGNSWQ